MNKKLLHTPEGVRDIYGLEYAKKLKVEKTLNSVIGAYGYCDIQTPTFEFFDVYSNEIGTTPSNELYKFFDKEGNTLVLRPDFTPSIARCSAKYFMDKEMPIRLQYSGNTFVNTSNLQGKLKEVTQMGAELINDHSVEAEAEIIAMVVNSLKEAGLHNFQLSIGNVEYFKGLCEVAGLDADIELELQQFISAKNYFAAEDLLVREDVPSSMRDMLLRSTELFGSIDVINSSKIDNLNKRSLSALERLQELYQVLLLYGVEEHIFFDLGLLSQYHYYTGVIFKAFTFGVGDAIVKGGRYDNLIQQFGKEAPAIGFVIVVDDLVEALRRQKIDLQLEEEEVTLYYNKENYKAILKEAMKLRDGGKKVSVVSENYKKGVVTT